MKTGRPRREEHYLIEERNNLIFQLDKKEISQADIARIFRVPRNTVCSVLKLKDRKKTEDKVVGKRTKYYRDKKREKYINDPQFRIIVKIRNRVSQVLKGKMTSGSKLRDIGCTPKQLKKHIEKQFTEDMTWDNWSQNGWHLDHIKPLSSFDLTEESQFLKASHYTNIRPMWAKDNLKKNNK